MTQAETEVGVGDVFGVVRLDMPNQSDPKTASLWFGIDRPEMKTCMFMGYFPYDNLYAGMGFERGYFLDEFGYTSKYDATFQGVNCEAYKNETSDETKIWYVNDDDRVIGYEYTNATVHRVWDARYQFYSQYEDFRMPTKYVDCDPQLYTDIVAEPQCPLNSDSSSSSSSSTFTPAALPCASKVFYHEVFDYIEGGQVVKTREFMGFLAFYDQYMTQAETEVGVGDVFGVVRLDVPDPSDPNTASLWFGIDRPEMKTCELEGYYSYDNLYAGMGYERGYFLDEFGFNSKYKAVFQGVDCDAYRNESGHETRIWYVNSEDRVIGYEFANETAHRVWNTTYQLYAQYEDFRMPSKFAGCVAKVYSNIQDEPKCHMNPDSSSSTAPVTSSSSHKSHHSSGAATVEITFAFFFLAIAISLLVVF